MSARGAKRWRRRIWIALPIACLLAIYALFLRPVAYSGAGLAVVHVDALYYYPDGAAKGERLRFSRSAKYKGAPLDDAGFKMPFREFRGDPFWTVARIHFSGSIERGLYGRTFVVNDLHAAESATDPQVIGAIQRSRSAP